MNATTPHLAARVEFAHAARGGNSAFAWVL